jgi:hypothetical protein
VQFILTCARVVTWIVSPIFAARVTVALNTGDYMYAIENNKKMDLIKETNWNAFASKNHKDIEVDVIFKSLEMITRLVEPFTNKNADTSLAELTIPLPREIASTILHEDLTDPNVMNTLELSVRHLNHNANDKISTTPEDRFGYTQIVFEKVVEKFKPLLDKCKFSNSISEENLRKDFNALTLHRYAIWLSCLYRLFYHFEHDYWDAFDDLFRCGTCGEYDKWISTMNNPCVDRARNVPVAEPETVIGITTAKRYQEPPLVKNRSHYLSLSERYLTLLYMQLEMKNLHY